MEKGLIISLIGILIVFFGLIIISIIISVNGYFFQKKKQVKVKDAANKITKINVTDELSVAIGLALYFHNLINKHYQGEITIKKLTPPMSSWVLYGRKNILDNNLNSYRGKKWKNLIL